MFFTIDITKVTNFYFLAKFFNDDYFKFLNFQVIRHWSRPKLTPHTKEIGIFSVLKKKLSEKKIKANFIVSRTTLCTQNIKLCMQKKKFRKMFVCVRNSICGWKKNKKIFWAKFSKLLKKLFLCRHQKMPVIQFPYMGIVLVRIFFQKNENLSFLSPDCFIRIKHPQK